MSKKFLLLFFLVLNFPVLIRAQTIPGFITGPDHYMELNAAGDDFTRREFIPAGSNYSFVFNPLADSCPWAVISKESGANIYTQLDLGKVDTVLDVYMLSPTLNLLSSKSYRFSQSIFNDSDSTAHPGDMAIVGLKLIAGIPDSFNISLLNVTELSSQHYYSGESGEFSVPGITPLADDVYYFVLYVNFVQFDPFNEDGFSLGFKENLVVEEDVHTTISEETFAKNDFIVYPNPVCNVIGFKGWDEDISIYNSTGRMILQIDYRQGELIDISSLQAGIYYAKRKSAACKFIKY